MAGLPRAGDRLCDELPMAVFAALTTRPGGSGAVYPVRPGLAAMSGFLPGPVQGRAGPQEGLAC